MKTNLHFYKTYSPISATVVELADTQVLETCVERHLGSSPSSRTIFRKVSKLGGKLASKGLQQCVQYVCLMQTATTKGVTKMRSVPIMGILRKKIHLIHKWNLNYYYCYSSLTIPKINSIHLWLVLHTTANIQRIVCAVLSTCVSKCSTNVHK